MAEAYGAEAPFRRPDELAGDHIGTVPVVAHAIEWLYDQGERHEAVCCIYATAPFVQIEDLRAGQNALRRDNDVNYSFSVTSYAFPIQRALRLTRTGRVAMFQPEHFITRSQDLEEAWHDAGQFYWGRAKAWLTGEPIFTNHACCDEYRATDRRGYGA